MSLKRISWIDEATQSPVIEVYARQLNSFVESLADGRVDSSELEAQQRRVVDLMKEVEPKLGDDLHEKITTLLCELSALNIMNCIVALERGRPRTRFRG